MVDPRVHDVIGPGLMVDGGDPSRGFVETFVDGFTDPSVLTDRNRLITQKNVHKRVNWESR